MKPLRLFVGCASVLLATIPVAYAQSAISARAGLVHYVMGEALLDEKAIEPKLGYFPEVKEKSVLRTGQGRAEVLLNPGIFLRIGEKTSFRMISSRLIDTRVEVLTGAAEVEAAEVAKDAGVTLVAGDAVVTLRKAGIYRFDMEPARLRVFAGEASVEFKGQTLPLTSGHMMTFAGEKAGVSAKFDREDLDALSRWARQRGGAIAMANVSAAKQMKDSGSSLYSGSWRFNPYFGMFTYIPANGMFYSPYGYQYWSPYTVGRVYYNPPSYSGSSGGGWGAYNNRPDYSTSSNTYSGYSGTSASTASSPSYSSVSTSGSASSAASGSSSIGHGGGGGGSGRGH